MKKKKLKKKLRSLAQRLRRVERLNMKPQSDITCSEAAARISQKIQAYLSKQSE